MGTRNNKKINVERIGNSGHPITTNPTPVRHVMFQDKIPYTTFGNGTVVQSTVNRDGVNEQILRKSNLNPAYKLEVKYDGVSTPDTLGLYRANHPNDLWAYDKIKPGTKEYKEAVEKFDSYGIPLATYGEAHDNLEEVEKQVDELQEGGEIPTNDQQQLFVAIITDMAKTLGVEPSQEFAEAVLTAFENQDDSQGLLTLFTKTKNKFMSETGLFKEGGKMSAFIKKFKCGGKSPKKKTSKKQMGGEVEDSGMGYITTPVNDIKARRQWRQRTGGSRADARRAQRILAADLERKGWISRVAARNSAAAMMSDPQRFATPAQIRAIQPGQASLNVPMGGVSRPQQLSESMQFTPAQPVEEAPNYDGLNFNQAFASARKDGLETFTWNGKDYTTELAKNPLQSQMIDRVNMGFDTEGQVVSDPNGYLFVNRTWKNN